MAGRTDVSPFFQTTKSFASLRAGKFITSGKSKLNLMFGYSLLFIDNDLKERRETIVKAVSL
jgi:hypothetical protein